MLLLRSAPASLQSSDVEDLCDSVGWFKKDSVDVNTTDKNGRYSAKLLETVPV